MFPILSIQKLKKKLILKNYAAYFLHLYSKYKDINSNELLTL